MIKNLNKILSLEKNFQNKKIAVVGDVMLDCYFQGEVKRISPEAPVPVVEVENEFFRFGGAANVAYNLITLGAVPYLFGVIGNDRDGEDFLKLMDEVGIDKNSIVISNERPTTAKTRVIADSQHVVRIDKENKSDISQKIEDELFAKFNSVLDNLDAIILQDYNKGVLTESLIHKVIEAANKAGKIIMVDPKFKNFFAFENVTVFKPNRKETSDALGMLIENENDLISAGEQLLAKLNSKYVLITLSEEGIALFEKDKPLKRVETKARRVADVSGAGDTVISTMTMALCAGADISEAAYLANFAGGLVCEEVGIVPIDREKLFDAVERELR